MYNLLYKSHEDPSSFEIMIPSNHKEIKLKPNDSVVIELDNEEIVLGFVKIINNGTIMVDRRKITRTEIVNVIKVPPRNMRKEFDEFDRIMLKWMTE